MAEKKEVLIDVTVNRANALASLEEVNEQILTNKKSLQDLNKAYERGEISVSDYVKQSTALTLEQKELSATQRDLAKNVQAESNSINGLRAKLSALTKERNNLNTGTAEGAKRFNQLQKEIRETNDALSGFEQEGGDFRRNVGNYASGVQAITLGFNGLPPAIGNTATAFSAFSAAATTSTGAISLLRVAMIALTAVPIIAVISGIALAMNKSDSAGTNFAGVVERLTRVLNIVFSPIVKVGEAILKIADNLLDAAFAGESFEAQLDAIADRERDQSVQIAKNNRLIDEYIIKSKNKTLTEEQRIEFLNKASKLEEENLQLELKNVDERLAINQKLNKQTLKDREILNKNLAKVYGDWLAEESDLTDEELENVANLEVERERLLQESVNLQEKVTNRRALLEQEITTERQKELEKQKQLQEKAARERQQLEEKNTQDFIAALNERQKAIISQSERLVEIERERNEKNAQAEIALEQYKQEIRVSYLNEILSETELTEEERLNILREKQQEEIELINMKREIALENEELTANERILINERANDEIAAITRRSEREITAIKDKSADQQKKIEQDKQEFIASAVSGALGAISTAAQGNAELQKGIAVAQTGIDTYFAAQKAYSSQLSIPTPDAPVRAAIAAGVAIAQGLARVAAIAATPAFAGGGEFLTKGPQMIMVGDNPGGVERVTVEPLSGKGVTKYNRASNLIQLAGGGSVTAGSGVVRQSITQSSDNVLDIAASLSGVIGKLPNPEVSVKEFVKVQRKVNTKEKATAI